VRPRGHCQDSALEVEKRRCTKDVSENDRDYSRKNRKSRTPARKVIYSYQGESQVHTNPNHSDAAAWGIDPDKSAVPVQTGAFPYNRKSAEPQYGGCHCSNKYAQGIAAKELQRRNRGQAKAKQAQ